MRISARNSVNARQAIGPGLVGLLFGLGVALPHPLLLIIALLSVHAWLFRRPMRKALGELSIAERSAMDCRLTVLRMRSDDYCSRLDIKPVGLSLCPDGAHYDPFLRTIRLSPRVVARLPMGAVELIVAHEVGHAARGLRARLRLDPAALFEEERLADEAALALCGVDWRYWTAVMEGYRRVHRGLPLGVRTELFIRALVLADDRPPVNPDDIPF